MLISKPRLAKLTTRFTWASTTTKPACYVAGRSRWLTRLESWGDVIDDHGNYGVCQPQIKPLLGGRSVPEVLAVMLGEDETDGDVITRRTADAIAGKSLAEREWRQLLHDGFAEGMEVTEKLSITGKAKELTADEPVAISGDDIDQNEF